MNTQKSYTGTTRSDLRIAIFAPIVLALIFSACSQSPTFNKEFTILALEPLPGARVPEKAPSFDWPVSAIQVSSGFGPRWGDKHQGLDLVAKAGTPILASADGIVIESKYDPRGYGNMIVIEHDENTQTLYGHNSRNLVQKGRRVKKGQTIAWMGHTGFAFGTHLHFEYRVNGHAANPELYLDPLCAPTGARPARLMQRCEEIASR